MPKLGSMVEYTQPDGVVYPAVVMANSDEGGTVGLIVFAPEPYHLAGITLADDGDAAGDPLTDPLPPITSSPVVDGGTPIGDSIPPVSSDPVFTEPVPVVSGTGIVPTSPSVPSPDQSQALADLDAARVKVDAAYPGSDVATEVDAADDTADSEFGQHAAD